jgi:trigger factor
MNISKEVTGDLTAILEVKITEEDYREQVDNQLKDYRKKASVPGFRPGKVPMGMVKKMYNGPVMADTISRMLGVELDKYIQDEELRIFGQPLPNQEKQEAIDFENGKEFTFYYDLGMMPEVNVELNDKIKVDLYKIEAAQDTEEKYLEDMRKRFGKQSNPESIEEGDLLMGQITELDADGNPKEGGVDNHTAISIDKIKLKGVREKMLKMKADKTLDFNPARALKDDQELANVLTIDADTAKDMKSDFRFTFKEASRIELAEMNEEFFGKVYENSDIKTEEELRARIREDIEKSFENETNRQFFNEVTKILTDNAEIQLPDEFLKRWIYENSQNEEKEENRITREQLEIQYPSYTNSLKWQLVEESLVKQYDLKVDQEAIREKVKQLLGLQAFGADADDEKNQEILNQVTDSVMKDQNQIQQIAQQIMEEKLIELFKKEVKAKDKKIALADFEKMIKEQYQQ